MSHKRITDSGIYSNYPIESLVPASHNITKFKKNLPQFRHLHTSAWVSFFFFFSDNDHECSRRRGIDLTLTCNHLELY